MKVFELISELMKLEAGREVSLALESTARSGIVSVYSCGDSVVCIVGGDAELLDEDGSVLVLLSEAAEAYSEEVTDGK